jgi:hypothetical protein
MKTSGEALNAFVRAIRALGYEGTFGGKKHIYLDIAGWKYWTMGAPINKTIIINRAALPDT